MKIEADYFNEDAQTRTVIVDVSVAEYFEVSRAAAKTDRRFKRLQKFRPADKSAPWSFRPGAEARK